MSTETTRYILKPTEPLESLVGKLRKFNIYEVDGDLPIGTLSESIDFIQDNIFPNWLLDVPARHFTDFGGVAIELLQKAFGSYSSFEIHQICKVYF